MPEKLANEASIHAAGGGCDNWHERGDGPGVGVAGRHSPAAGARVASTKKDTEGVNKKGGSGGCG